MIEYEKLEESYANFTNLLKQYCDDGWWDVDFVLERLSTEQINRRLQNDRAENK